MVNGQSLKPSRQQMVSPDSIPAAAGPAAGPTVALSAPPPPPAHPHHMPAQTHRVLHSSARPDQKEEKKRSTTRVACRAPHLDVEAEGAAHPAQRVVQREPALDHEVAVLLVALGGAHEEGAEVHVHEADGVVGGVHVVVHHLRE